MLCHTQVFIEAINSTLKLKAHTNAPNFSTNKDFCVFCSFYSFLCFDNISWNNYNILLYDFMIIIVGVGACLFLDCKFLHNYRSMICYQQCMVSLFSSPKYYSSHVLLIITLVILLDLLIVIVNNLKMIN